MDDLILFGPESPNLFRLSYEEVVAKVNKNILKMLCFRNYEHNYARLTFNGKNCILFLNLIKQDEEEEEVVRPYLPWKKPPQNDVEIKEVLDLQHKSVHTMTKTLIPSNRWWSKDKRIDKQDDHLIPLTKNIFYGIRNEKNKRVRKEDNSKNTIPLVVVFTPLECKSLVVNSICEDIISCLETNGYSSDSEVHVILVSGKYINENTKKMFQDQLKNAKRIETFTQDDFMMDKINYTNNPISIYKLSKKEKALFMKRYSLTDETQNKALKINDDDPLARYLGLSPEQVIKIRVSYGGNLGSTYYRICFENTKIFSEKERALDKDVDDD